MKIPQMIAAEFRRLFSSKMSIIALIALLCVPILYGGLYLWANQDPYAKLDEVPVALVVSDTGADVNGTLRNIGDEVADELLASDTFDWHSVSDAEATAGLDNGTYDFAVEIPADFTEAIASISTDNPRQAELILRTNDANNYLASTIGKSAIETIRTTVSEKVITEAGRTMLDALHDIRVSLIDARDGSQQLVDGLVSAQDGQTQLEDGATSLADGTSQIHTGASDLATGTQTLADGLDTLADGAAQVSDGTAALKDVADKIGSGVQDAIDAVPTAREDLVAAMTEQGLTQDQIDTVLAALDPLASDLTAAGEKVTSATDSIDTLASGAQQVADGALSAADGAQTAADGAATLEDATLAAADGASALKDGIVTLGDGLDQLHDGASTLHDGLADGVEQIPDSNADTRAAQAKTLGAPVDITKDQLTAAQNYGAGLAPFFAALAAWIGIYALFLIVKPISRRAVTALRTPVRVTIAGWATPALLGAVQMLGLFGVLALTLGFQFANPLAALGILVLASATYAGIILALNVWLGSVGQFIGLILMVLQLVTAGGTFPWQTLPAPLAALHHILPMGYVVDAMRQVMYGAGGWSRVSGDLTTIVLWLVIALLLAVIGVTRMTHRRTLRDLQPSLIG